MSFSIESLSAHAVTAVIAGIVVVLILLFMAIVFFRSSKKPTLLSQKELSLPKDVDLLNDLEAAALFYKTKTAELGAAFKLAQLYQLTQRDHLPHPHLTIRSLRESGFLLPAGEDLFTWKE